MKSRKLFMETVSFVEFLSHNKDLIFFYAICYFGKKWAEGVNKKSGEIV